MNNGIEHRVDNDFTRPFMVGDYKPATSFLGKMRDSLIPIFLHPNGKYIFRSNSESHKSGDNYSLEDFSGGHIDELPYNMVKVTLICNDDGRKADVYLSRVSGDRLKVDEIRGHITEDGHNGAEVPLGSISFLVR